MKEEDFYKTEDEFRQNYNTSALQVGKKFLNKGKNIQVNKNSSPFVAVREANIYNDLFLQAQMIKVYNNLSYKTADRDTLIRVFAPQYDIKVKQGTPTLQIIDFEILGAGTLTKDLIYFDNNNVQYTPVEEHVFTNADIGIQKVLCKCTENGAIYSDLNTITNAQTLLDFIGSVNNSEPYTSLGTSAETTESLRTEINIAERGKYTNSDNHLRQRLVNNGCEDAVVRYNPEDNVVFGIKPKSVAIVVKGGNNDDIIRTIGAELINSTCEMTYVYQSEQDQQHNGFYQSEQGTLQVKWCTQRTIDSYLFFDLYKSSTQVVDEERLKEYIISTINSEKKIKLASSVNINIFDPIIKKGIEEQNLKDIVIDGITLSKDGSTKVRVLEATRIDDYFLFDISRISITISNI